MLILNTNDVKKLFSISIKNTRDAEQHLLQPSLPTAREVLSVTLVRRLVWMLYLLKTWRSRSPGGIGSGN